ncbi:rho GTPase-activating protein 25-like isoform X2 [Pristis pectinata]|uniref:rho GTPase-activating protein 25-like isoform X2 n=1 Tax=Pristis pectinata TaxID=685728 RepID=UPI00223CE615|nr:rho GTPase-activating protein 25-like isoform X2 [Pristis pectinata]
MWVGRHLHRLSRGLAFTEEKSVHFEGQLSPPPFQKRQTMSLKLPRNVWDFNLKADSGRIGRSKSVMPGEHSSNRPSSPNMLERPVKSGWLKKKRSLMKQWQSRWFVLRGFYLTYYKEEEDGKPQGCIILQDCKVNEHPANPEDPGKFLFEIVPGSGDRDRLGNVQDSHMLMANSQNEMEDWVKAIRRAMGSLSTAAVFGQRLTDTVAYEQKFGQHLVPIIVEKCADFMREQGLKEEGIFRLPGQDNLVKELRDAFDAGERPSFNRDTDVHTVASLFKLYLRELPEPVVPWSQYEDFLACSQMMGSDKMLGQQELTKQISLLPQANYNLLSYICRFLHEVQLHSAMNKMGVDNLATVIGVNLFRPKTEDPVAIMRGAPQIQKLMTVMISNHDELFPKHKDKPPSPLKSDSKKASIQRSMVGWGASEFQTGSATSAYGPTQIDGIGDNTLESEFESWNECPRKRTQTLPASSCTLNSVGEMSHSVNTGSSSADYSDKRKSFQENITERHKRSYSQDLMKTPTAYHQVSTYDNIITCSGDSQEKDSVGSERSPEHSALSNVEQWSSGNSCLKVSQNLSTKTQKDQPKVESKDEKVELDVGEMNMEQIRRQLIELREELNNQKQSYEERIESVLTENYEVWAKVVRLNEQMEEDKKRYEAMESKLRDTTRALEDAEKRNLVLEKKLEDSFQAKNKASA